MISVSIIGFIGFLFVLKFSAIYNFYPAIFTAVYVTGFTGFFYYFGRYGIEARDFRLNNKVKYLFIILGLISLIYIIIVPRIGQIGRVPAIIDWLDLYFAGEFPYNSGYTPSSFPALFFMAMPFYFINFLGIFEFAGFALFLFLIYQGSKNSRELSNRFLLLFATPVIYYEFVVRCELFFNVVLILFCIYLAERYLRSDKLNLNFFLIAILFGIGLSTRSVVAVIYASYLLYKFRYDIKNLVIFSAIVILVFLAFLVPFILWDKEAFINNGPFAIQSHLSNLPFALSLFFIITAALSGWMVSRLHEVFYTSGVIIFFMVTISYVLKIFEFGFDIAFFEDKIDLSYLAFVIPLLILSITDYKVDRFRGRYFT